MLWRDRGKAPLGYIKGMAADTALAISNANSERDALAHYDSMFAARGMRNDVSGIDTQRHLFVQLREVIKKESSLRGGSLSAERTQIEAGKATLAGVHPIKREIVDVAAAQF